MVKLPEGWRAPVEPTRQRNPGLYPARAGEMQQAAQPPADELSQPTGETIPLPSVPVLEALPSAAAAGQLPSLSAVALSPSADMDVMVQQLLSSPLGQALLQHLKGGNLQQESWGAGAAT